MLQDLFDLRDTGFDITLFVFCRVVFGILGQIALLSGFLDFFGYALTFCDLQE